jgi:transposase
MKTWAIVTGVSVSEGVELSHSHLRSVTAANFVDFLECLSLSQGGRPFAIFMDNMRAHHSKLVKRAYERLNILPIFSLPYSPQFNGIESVFSMVKATYKRLLLKAIIGSERICPKAFIGKAIQELQHHKIKACLEHGIKEIECLRIKLNFN